MAPDELEPELQSGSWLILAFALWSAPDLRAICTAATVSRKQVAQVAVRPFDDFTEFATWCPDAPIDTRSPVWLLLRGGRVVRTAVGPLDEAAVIELLGD